MLLSSTSLILIFLFSTASLASVIMGLAPILGKETTLENLDMFLHLLKDDFPDVRLNIISKLDAVNQVVGIEKLSQSLLPAIYQLAEDRQWRVRLAIIEHLPLLASQLGQDFFDEKLGALCLAFLGDTVCAVREAATLNLRKLSEVFGREWALSYLLPKALSLYAHPNYLYRITTLSVISAVTPIVGEEEVNKTLLPLTIRLAQDKVPNIRFKAAKTLEKIGAHLSQEMIQTQVAPCLSNLLLDSDADVVFYASQALRTVC
jgi:serine/threonine-protein phosphatase 2A regulatory subunit A